MYDYLIKNAKIVDGTGSRAYMGSLAVSNGKIDAVGQMLKGRARETVNAEGLTLSPGFIDIHAHSEIEMLNHPHMFAKLGDGITTDCSGNCGIGVFPLNENRVGLRALSEEVLGVRKEWDWDDISSFREKVEETGVGINTAFLSAHAPLRVAVLGKEANREATKEEIQKMCALLDKTLSDGARGFSSGLYYAPCLFASKTELEALLKVVKAHDAFFAVHHRCEGDDVLESVGEVLDLAKKTGVRLEISHLKAIGKRNQDKVDRVLKMIEEARKDNVDVKFDQYPYTYGSTSLFSLLPPDVQKLSRIEQRFALSIDAEVERIEKEIENPEGWDSIYSLVGPENIKISELTNNRSFEGLNLVEAGKKLNLTPLRALLSLLADEGGAAVMTDVTETEENLIRILTHPLMSFGTDSLYSSRNPHPRSYSAAVELLSEYVIKRNAITLEEAIRKMTGENAIRLGLTERGTLEKGKAADLVLFDEKELKAEYNDGVKPGIKAVFVNGKPAVRGGVYTAGLFGKVL